MGELRGRVGSEVNSPSLRRWSLGGLGERNGAEKSLGRGITFPIGSSRARTERAEEGGREGTFSLSRPPNQYRGCRGAGRRLPARLSASFSGPLCRGRAAAGQGGFGGRLVSCCISQCCCPHHPGRLSRWLPRSALAVLAAVRGSLPLGAMSNPGCSVVFSCSIKCKG